MRLTTTILAAISMLLMLAAASCWIRSYWNYEGVAYYTQAGTARVAVEDASTHLEGAAHGRVWGIVSQRGIATFGWIGNPLPEPWTWHGWSHPVSQPIEPGVMSLMAPMADRGFRIGSGKAPPFLANQLLWELPYWRISIPYWLIVLLLALLPFRWFSRYRLMLQREREGRCIHCGHDLAGQASGKCPGCGREIERDESGL